MKNSSKWILLCLYTIGIFIITPYLPLLIKVANSNWSKPGVSRFVLGIELAMALFLTALATYFLIRKKKKSVLLLVSIVCVLTLSFIIYQFIPNPYEFTHLPEYAVLSMLLYWAWDKKKKSREKIEKASKPHIFMNKYFQSGAITGMVGSADEIYQLYLPNRAYTWYDILLNIFGGILGLLIIWGIKRQK